MLLVMVVFGIVLRGDFVWDDPVYLLQVHVYRQFDVAAVLFGLGNGLEYQPVRDLSYLIDGLLWGWTPIGFHGTNLLLYALTVGAVFLLAEELAVLLQLRSTPGREQHQASWFAFWTAALFALHPVHVEPVAFISGGRNTLLAALFSFLSVRAFCRFLRAATPGGQPLLATGGWLLLALLSKSTAATLPLFLVLLAWVSPQRPAKSKVLALLPLVAVGGLGAFGHAVIAAKAGLVDPLGSHIPLGIRGVMALQIPFFYLGKLLLPISLSADYGSVVRPDPAGALVIAACIGWGVALVAAVVAKRHCSGLFVALAWYATTLVPVLYLLPSPIIVADRYALLPSFGFCFALAWCGFTLMPRWKRAGGVIGVALLGTVAVLSFRQARTWRSGIHLWEQALKVRPGSIRALENLGTNLFVAGEYGRAFPLLAQAKQLDTRSTAFDFFSGFQAYTRRDLVSAAHSFRAALERKPDLMDALYYLASMCEETRQPEAAAELYRRVLASRDIDRGGYRTLAREHLLRLEGAGR
jgi:hypothetical protein